MLTPTRTRTVGEQPCTPKRHAPTTLTAPPTTTPKPTASPPEVTITGDGITGDIVTWRSWRPGGPRLVHVDAEGAVLTGDGLDVVIAHLTALRGTCG